MSLLISVKEAEFTFIKEKTNSTAGNLSVQVQKLKEVGYIEVNKQFKDNYPQTTCKVTPKGIEACKSIARIFAGRKIIKRKNSLLSLKNISFDGFFWNQSEALLWTSLASHSCTFSTSCPCLKRQFTI
jgi:hypothetical protein